MDCVQAGCQPYASPQLPRLNEASVRVVGRALCANLTAAQTASMLKLTSAMTGSGRQVLNALHFATATVLVLNPFTFLPTAL